MGAAESSPRVGADGKMNHHHDYHGNFCTPPNHNTTSDTFNVCQLPSKKCLSPTHRNCSQQPKDGRSSCNTISTILTSESAPYTPHSSRCEDLPYSPVTVIRDDSSDDCWGGQVLMSILSRILPQKKHAISFNESFNSINSVKFANDNATTTVVESESIPNIVHDLSLPNQLALPSDLSCPDLEKSPHTRQQLRENSELEDEAILPQNNSTFPNKRNHHMPLIEKQHENDLEDLYHYLHDASKQEAESEFDAAISNLEEFLDQSRSFTSSSFYGEHLRAATLHKLGLCQWKAGRYFFSEHIFLDCIHMYQRLLDEDNLATDEPALFSQLVLETAHVLVSAGRVYLSKGEEDAAMRCYNECVQHLSSIPKSTCTVAAPITPERLFGQACVGAGRVYSLKGRLKSSLNRYKRALRTQLGSSADSPVASDDISALPIHEARVPPSDIAETLSHLGRLYEQWNDLDRAMECHANALSIYKSELDPYAVDIGYASNNVGQLYLRFGRYDEAEEAFVTAHQVFSIRLGNNHRNTADALLSIGQLNASQGRHKKALSMFKRVLRAQPAVSGQLLAVTFHSIAWSYEASYKLEKALKYYEQTLSVLDTALPCHLNRARLLHRMAKIAMQAVDSKGDYVLLDQALTWLEEAAEIYNHNEGKAPIEVLHLESSIEETRKRLRRKAQMFTTQC
mmetsp:Transcript_25745/g.54409  ORF Transcript_25745/g.54409 Transcript_25745/m.54409 type:complete len:682 (-) Transcript_25745:42-2087(-)|eukprot:CAMPEP_0183728012 /NCGR_PEP_ID=MMETSP0737-20130205/26982_1 /TAXON_ID=385413 /ORGANISM="Thalassiosira miniscula, Strain CCMP1093" /LENGTH=681 /DNA_ID=CAMNT_0025959819 /DNA_START=240 /DNA_END=2285 /DNA_ORIENTATION=-